MSTLPTDKFSTIQDVDSTNVLNQPNLLNAHQPNMQLTTESTDPSSNLESNHDLHSSNDDRSETDATIKSSSTACDSKSIETIAQSSPTASFPLSATNQRLIDESKQKIRDKINFYEREFGLSSKRSSIQISDGDLSLDDLNSSLETHSSSTRDLDSSATDLQLMQLTRKLQSKEDEIEKLSKFRRQVELEVDELTATLFQEANRMVWDAKFQKSRAEKSLKEANMKIDVLQAEVKALKSLVSSNSSTSDFSASSNRMGGARTLPNCSSNSSSSSKMISFGQHLTNNLKSNLSSKSIIKSSKSNGLKAILQKASLQSSGRTKSMSESSAFNQTNSSKSLTKHSNVSKSKRSPSNYELGSEPSSSLQTNLSNQIEQRLHLRDESISIASVGEIDPLFYEQFSMWRENPVLDADASDFMRKLYAEDIRPLFDVQNSKLTDRLIEAITRNNVIIELNTDPIMTKKCALFGLPRICKHRIKLDDDWLNISQLARNRISAVCDLFCYLRYINQGLVKSESPDVYWEVIRRRRNVAFAKLGFSCI